MPEDQAQISIFDRGLLFGDGIYEVASVLDGKLVESDRHKWRLEYSLRELNIPMPLPWPEIEAIERELVRRNHIDQGMVYFQVTRGVADREFWYSPDLKPSLIAFTQVKQRPQPCCPNGLNCHNARSALGAAGY